MTLHVFKENDVISAAAIYTAKEEDPKTSSPINDENCRVAGNGESVTPFSVNVTFDATSGTYPCGIAVVWLWLKLMINYSIIDKKIKTGSSVQQQQQQQQQQQRSRSSNLIEDMQC